MSVDRFDGGRVDAADSGPASDGDIDPGGSGGSGGAGAAGAAGSGGAGGSGGSVATGGTVGRPDAGVDRPGAGGSGGKPGEDAAVPDADASNGDADALPPIKSALLVVADPTAMVAVDHRIEGLLRAKGFAVILGDDDAMGSTANGHQLVVLSGTCASEKLTNKYRDTPIPTLVLEPSVFDDMKMTGTKEGTDFGEDDATQITITAKDNPLAAMLAGDVPVVSATSKVAWGKPGAMAVKVATFKGNANKVAVFSYETGAPLIAPNLAPARRVGLFAGMAAVPNLTPKAEQLINAAIEWLAP